MTAFWSAALSGLEAETELTTRYWSAAWFSGDRYPTVSEDCHQQAEHRKDNLFGDRIVNIIVAEYIQISVLKREVW